MKNALVTIAALFLFCSTLMAQDDENARKSLKGLTGVYVRISPAPDAAQIGLSEVQVQADVELRLRTAGIKVLTQEQWFTTPGMPALWVSLGTAKKQGLYSFALNINLQQMVSLNRDPQISVLATTWTNSTRVGILAATSLIQVRSLIEDDVDKFINTWLSVNPKH
jgi:hypothetical protein